MCTRHLSLSFYFATFHLAKPLSHTLSLSLPLFLSHLSMLPSSLRITILFSFIASKQKVEKLDVCRCWLSMLLFSFCAFIYLNENKVLSAKCMLFSLESIKNIYSGSFLLYVFSAVLFSSINLLFYACMCTLHCYVDSLVPTFPPAIFSLLQSGCACLFSSTGSYMAHSLALPSDATKKN